MQQRFLLQILLLAQHVSGTTMPIIRSSRVLYSGCCLCYFVLWFSNCWSGAELRVMCPVFRMLAGLYVGNLSFIVHVIYLIMCLHTPAKKLWNLRCALVLLRLVTSGLQLFGVHRQTDRIYYKENNLLISESVFDTERSFTCHTEPTLQQVRTYRIYNTYPLQTKRWPLYLKIQFVLRSKHFSSRL